MAARNRISQRRDRPQGRSYRLWPRSHGAPQQNRADRVAEPPNTGGDRYRSHRPDAWQLSAATALLGLGALPLLLALRLQIGLFVLALLGISAAIVRWPRLQPNRWLLLALTLLGGLLVLGAYHSLVGQNAGSALLLSMIALKRLESRTVRDLRVLMVTFGFLLVIQFLFGESPWLAAWMMLMLIGAVALLADLSVSVHPEHRLADWRAAGRLALVLTAQAVPLALVLFVFFPRLDAPLWDLELGDERGVTGLTDSLEPGSISELIVSGEDAFRVRFDSPPSLPTDAMYWRGPVLWRTNGQRWLPRPEQQTDAGSATDRIPTRTLISEPIRYSVLLEPTDQHWLFALELPTQLPDGARLTEDFQLLAARPVSDLRLYRASSVVDYRMTGLSALDERAALQLPPNVTERMRALVDGWRKQSASPAEVVEQALDFFNRAPFRYTLLPPTLGDNPADQFLFETRAGFCEHYASSFTLLMRLAGIPARIVLGYLGAEYNPLSGDYLVRQSDAHAWAEVWLEGQGWVRVDPTAAIAADRIERELRFDTLGRTAPARFRIEETSALGRLIRGARFLADAFDSGWKNWVIGFSSRNQLQLLDRLGLGALREYGLAVLMMVGGSAVMLAWVLTLARQPRPRDPVQRCWQQFGRRLARVGLPPERNEGPLHYLERIQQARPDLQQSAAAIVEQYLRLRYRPTTKTATHRDLCRQVRRFRPGSGPAQNEQAP
ncbi:MAG: DUF3488 domain-containing protein [Gammaproteobacteria bacterium]|jgi:transglutaminase-like putative cysteine protease|nr:DUF3488 domain-containing protein [Gammaproteobacteria bacterium]